MRELGKERLAREMMVARCETDRELFARYFFEAKLDKPFSPFHLACLRAPKTKYSERLADTGTMRARMGPRGNGKSTIYLKVELLHDIVYGYEEFIAILAESASLAQDRLREIRVELEFNRRLHKHFGRLDQTRDVWRNNAIETDNEVRVIAKSMGSQARGIKHPITDARPTKIVLDDAEDSQDVLNPELRARTERIFKQDIIGAGTIDGRTNFQVTGTPLHREALLPTLKDNPAWDFRAFPAVISWPVNTKLWEKCRSIWAKAGAFDETLAFDDPESWDGKQSATLEAKEFYEANRVAMDKGAQVLWPGGEDLFTLQVWRWSHGEVAFSKEKQLVPRDLTHATFNTDLFVRHTIQRNTMLISERGGAIRRLPLNRLRFVAFHDPAKADKAAGTRKKSALGDFAAIVVIGIEDLQGGGRNGHVVEAWINRVPVSEQIKAAYEISERWKIQRMILEEDNLGLVRDGYRRERARRQKAHLFAQVPLYGVTQKVNKIARVSSMEPAFANGWLTANEALPRVWWNQMDDHPTGDHDDGPDATEGAWRHGTIKAAGLSAVA